MALEEIDDDLVEGESEAEAEARRETQVVLSESSQAFIDGLVDKLMRMCDDIAGHPLRVYQKPLARRIFESCLISDGAYITALASRQSGKTEDIASVIATCMIMLPRLAKAYPDAPGRATKLSKYADGMFVGAFAPVQRQSNILYDRICGRLRSEAAKRVMSDPEINEVATGLGSTIKLKNCYSLCRKISCHPRSIIEGDTFHVILIDEAQGGNNEMINKSVIPMGTATRATYVYTGTPTYTKNFFYDQIQKNKRVILKRGRVRQNHFQWDWKEVAKVVPAYKLAVMDAMIQMGEDSDEFRMSFKIEWLIEKGMFTTAARLDELGNVKLQSTEKFWQNSEVVVGIDCGRIQDRTVVTVVFVDWGNPDPAGYYFHQVLNWLDLEGVDWETQYFKIVEFLSAYRIYKVGVDTGGIGDVVIDRLRTLMPHTEFVAMTDGTPEQSRRWKHLKVLMERAQISWPQGAKVRALRTWRRFYQEMCDLLIDYKGPNLKCEAPKSMDAHDDYPASLAMAVILSKEEKDQASTQFTAMDNFLYEDHRSRVH
jgi:DNA-binding Xre family transcriptional regulator